MTLLELEEFDLLSALFFIDCTLFRVTSFEAFNSLLKGPDLVQISLPFILQFLNLILKGLLAMLCQQLFSHGEGHRGLIEDLVG